MPDNKPKIAIIYCSVHHKNTLKLIEAISKKYPDILLLDAAKVILKNLQEYDIIGIASGIFYGKMHKAALTFLENNLPEHKKSFIIYTSGSEKADYGKDAELIIRSRNCTYLGKYSCPGFDTFGPFKLVGGLNKNHPDIDEINGAVTFMDGLIR